MSLRKSHTFLFNLRLNFWRFGTLLGLIGLLLVGYITLLWLFRPLINWTDRRPIGALFLASNFHVSETNPRGWFNEPGLNVHGATGTARFRNALLKYAETSIQILHRCGAQGMIVWDLEGEQFPHKTTYIGDPRLVGQLAPEMAGVVDEFFGMFVKAGFRVGVTIRPQDLVFETGENARQKQVRDYDRTLLEKIDYARGRWGVTLFYIDSNGGALWPGEVFRLRRIARSRPGILLIPEHHDFLYYGFSALYGSMQKGAGPTSPAIRTFCPSAFQVLAVPDRLGSQEEDATSRVTRAYRNRDVLLFPAWYEGPPSQLMERLRGR